MVAAVKKVVDITQQEEGEAAQWANEPWNERDSLLLAHTERPFNAEPPNSALMSMITPKGLHYRRQHTPVPVVDVDTYTFSIGKEGSEPKQFKLVDIQNKYKEKDLVVTLMCTGNRRSEYNNENDGETMGLPWKNGSISTARWTGCALVDVLKDAGFDFDTLEDEGYNFMTLYGLEDYHISVPLSKAFAKKGDCTLAWLMNGEILPRDHGFPLRVLVPGYVGARSVKWLSKIVLCKEEAIGMHQRGIAYKQLAPNHKALSAVTPAYIESLPPIDHVPVTSAITSPNPGQTAVRGQPLKITGYAYSGAGLAVIRVDVSTDGGKSWGQAELTRGAATQGIRSCTAWAWVQWEYAMTIPPNVPGSLNIVCKAVDDQYNQQPHDTSSIWNLRGILNTSWGNVALGVKDKGKSTMEISDEAMSGDGSLQNVGIKVAGKFKSPVTNQWFDTQAALDLHLKFLHDPKKSSNLEE